MLVKMDIVNHLSLVNLTIQNILVMMLLSVKTMFL